MMRDREGSATTSLAHIWDAALRLAALIPDDAPARWQSAGNDHTDANQAALYFASASGISHGINGLHRGLVWGKIRTVIVVLFGAAYFGLPALADGARLESQPPKP